MVDINYQLNSIIIKYNMDRQYKGFRDSFKAVELLNDIVDNLQQNEEIMFIGSDKTDLNMIREDIRVSGKFEYLIVDINDGNSFDKIDSNKMVIIASYYWGKELSSILALKDIKHIWLYDYFLLNGLNIDHNYYNIFNSAGYTYKETKSLDYSEHDSYAEIFYIKKKIENSSNIYLKKMYFEKLIFNFLFIRDFVSVKFYIDKYLQEYSQDIIDYQNAWGEISHLLANIQKNMNKRKDKDIMIFLVDALEFGNDECMPFLSKLDKECLTFTNAYTVTPYTDFTLKTMVQGIKAVDDMSFKVIDITEQNSKLISYLKRQNYDFKYYGSSKRINIKQIKAKFNVELRTPASMIYWNAINDCLNNESSGLYLMHSSYESHFPYVSADLVGERLHVNYIPRGMQSDFLSQQKNSLEYLDKQIKFYSSLLAESSAKIYMSDHGLTKYGRFHITLKVCAENISNKIEHRLFSLIDFNKLIEYILCPNKDRLNRLFRQNTDIQDVDYYTGFYLANRMNPKEFKPELMFGYCGVVTEKDIYLRYNHGIEYFHKHKNDGVLFTEDRVEYLRKMAEKERKDLQQEEIFQYASYTYKVIDKYYSRNKEYEEKKYEAIKQLFRELDEDLNIAIYTGRETSFKLLLAIGLELCKKVKYIIDVDEDCIAGKLGIKVIHPNEMNRVSIDAIIKSTHVTSVAPLATSSYKYKSNPELEKVPYIIIDLYKYLEERNIKCTHDFWMHEYIEEDFQVGFPFEEAKKATEEKLLQLLQSNS